MRIKTSFMNALYGISDGKGNNDYDFVIESVGEYHFLVTDAETAKALRCNGFKVTKKELKAMLMARYLRSSTVEFYSNDGTARAYVDIKSCLRSPEYWIRDTIVSTNSATSLAKFDIVRELHNESKFRIGGISFARRV